MYLAMGGGQDNELTPLFQYTVYHMPDYNQLNGYPSDGSLFSIFSSYDEYFAFIPIQVMANQSLFWTKTFSLVEILSMMNAMGVNVVSSSNARASEIINDIPGTPYWCGNG